MRITKDILGGKMKMLKKFIKDESGMTTVEYALLAVGIFLAIFAMVRILGSSTSERFSDMSKELNKK